MATLKWQAVAGGFAPRKARPSDAGFDLAVCHDAVVHAGRTAKLHTGVAVEIPEGHCALVMGRSSLAARGMLILGGVIDRGYEGEVVVLAASLGDELLFCCGDRIAQLLLVPLHAASEYGRIDTGLPLYAASDRGTKGFGSTGA